ncbi:MAG: alpha/beta hydrolase [Dehalococcoidia bacterium]|nr:alpha/beta hydrolase [Dehalococcoidia bacterium]
MEHREGKFNGYKGLQLYYQCWLPDKKPRAVLLVAHGLAEHSTRYKNLVDYFLPKGYAVYALDHRGHGKSEGTRSYVDNFNDYLTDLKTFYDMVRKENKDARIFLFGHSLGATIATAYAIEHQKELDGLIVSGASLVASTSVSPVLLAMAGVVSTLAPKMGVTLLDASAVSRDQAVVDAYVNDPLVFRGKVPARTGAELARMWKQLPEQMPKIKLPILIMHGFADRLANPAGSKLLYERVGSKDKTLKLYDNCYHEICNEPEREQVFRDMEAWLTKHIYLNI